MQPAEATALSFLKQSPPLRRAFKVVVSLVIFGLVSHVHRDRSALAMVFTQRPTHLASPVQAFGAAATRLAPGPRPHALPAAPARPTQAPRLRPSVTVASAPNSQRQAPVGNPQALPGSSKEVVDQAFASCKRAWEAGVKRQRIEITLPLIGATDIDDWPGGIRQQFKAAAPMVESLLRQLKNVPGLEGPLQAKIIDDADAVGAWVGDNIVLVLFPTAETLKEVRVIVEAHPDALVIFANPQWSTDAAQVISDFGILPWVRKAAAEFIASFADTYAVQPLRINGDYVQWLLSYPQGWQVSVLTGPGQATCILQAPQRPSYKEVEAALRALDWTMSSKGLFDRIQAEAEFNRRSVQAPPPRDD